MTTLEEAKEIAKRHVPEVIHNYAFPNCVVCKTWEWPCDTVRMAEALEELEVNHAALERHYREHVRLLQTGENPEWVKSLLDPNYKQLPTEEI